MASVDLFYLLRTSILASSLVEPGLASPLPHGAAGMGMACRYLWVFPVPSGEAGGVEAGRIIVLYRFYKRIRGGSYAHRAQGLPLILRYRVNSLIVLGIFYSGFMVDNEFGFGLKI